MMRSKSFSKSDLRPGSPPTLVQILRIHHPNANWFDTCRSSPLHSAPMGRIPGSSTPPSAPLKSNRKPSETLPPRPPTA